MKMGIVKTLKTKGTSQVEACFMSRLFPCLIATKNRCDQEFMCYGGIYRGFLGRIGVADRLYAVIDPVQIEEPIRINNGFRPKPLGES